MDGLGDGITRDPSFFYSDEWCLCDHCRSQAEMGGGGQLVQVGESSRTGSGAVQKKFPGAQAPDASDGALFDLFRGKTGKRLRFTTLRGGAKREHGADGAEWILAKANHRAQLHHGLIMVAGKVGVEHGVGEWPEGFDRAGAVSEGRGIRREPGENTHDVAIDDGGRNVERDAGDRRRRVGADAGQLLPTGGCLWRRGHGDHDLGEFVEVAGARVVAEAFPVFQYAFFGGGGQRAEVGKRRQPAGEIRENGLHLRLLQHELADNGFIKRRLIAPRQGTLVGTKPVEECALKSGFMGDQQ